METIKVSLGERSYEIRLSHTFEPLAGAVCGILPAGRALLVSDENVYPLYGAAVRSLLEQAGFQVTPAVIPAGEESKTLAQADALYTAAITAGLDRSSAVFALGGGVVGDLAGFVAATYLRGVPFIQLPTTLLSQVDSSVGGKVAVNHRLGKNLIGAFYQPRLVWIATDVLQTLPEREFFSGAAEVAKYGAIMSEPLFRLLEEKWEAFRSLESDVLTGVIAECCRLKARVVAEDEQEKGLRAILNFGHTIGHALEAATAYRYYLHGEAVLAGMVLAVHLALGQGLLGREDGERLLKLFARVGLKAAPPWLGAREVLAAMRQDKKRTGERLVFILPAAVGQVRVCNHLKEEDILPLLERYLKDAAENLLTVGKNRLRI
ncbi:MAG: 3-dehydroquinate synthase [Firmicutes bacterium]|mgnify:CR=1 FL=1|nr:3-dehydroquinate synthase [Bacillota bacterium]